MSLVLGVVRRRVGGDLRGRSSRLRAHTVVIFSFPWRVRLVLYTCDEAEEAESVFFDLANVLSGRGVDDAHAIHAAITSGGDGTGV